MVNADPMEDHNPSGIPGVNGIIVTLGALYQEMSTSAPRDGPAELETLNKLFDLTEDDVPPWVVGSFNQPGEASLRALLNHIFTEGATAEEIQMVYGLLYVPDPAAPAPQGPLPTLDDMRPSVLEIGRWMRVYPNHQLGVPKIYPFPTVEQLHETAQRAFGHNQYDDGALAAYRNGPPDSPLRVQPLLCALARDAMFRMVTGLPQLVRFAQLGIRNEQDMDECLAWLDTSPMHRSTNPPWE